MNRATKLLWLLEQSGNGGNVNVPTSGSNGDTLGSNEPSGMNGSTSSETSNGDGKKSKTYHKNSKWYWRP